MARRLFGTGDIAGIETRDLRVGCVTTAVLANSRDRKVFALENVAALLGDLLLELLIELEPRGIVHRRIGLVEQCIEFRMEPMRLWILAVRAEGKTDGFSRRAIDVRGNDERLLEPHVIPILGRGAGNDVDLHARIRRIFLKDLGDSDLSGEIVGCVQVHL